MCATQSDMKIPSELVPKCPNCGKMLDVNLRRDDSFVENAGLRIAAGRYNTFIQQNTHSNILFLELGVGYNTPGIIKYQFWQYTLNNPTAFYISINQDNPQCPSDIAPRSLCIRADIANILYDATHPQSE